MKIQRKWIVITVILGCLLYVSIYFYGVQSEAFKFSQEWLRQSDQIRERVGAVERTTLSLWGGYREKFSGSDRHVWLAASVLGEKGTVPVELELKKTDGEWVVIRSKIGS